MRFLKLGLGIAVLAITLWIIVGEQLSGASADATINAPLVTVRTPIAGVVDLPSRPLGSLVERAEVIATVSDPNADRTALDDLQLRRADASATIEEMQREIAASEAEKATLDQRTETYRKHRLAELTLRLTYARAQLARLKDQATPGDGALGNAQQEVDLLANALAAAQAGVFIGDGYNDAPFSEQRALELGATLATLDARLTAQISERAALDERIKAEARLANARSTAQLKATVQGILWKVVARDGAHVERGDPVVQLVDCQDALVTASVTEGVYQGLRRGQTVRFRPLGQGPTLEGVILRLAGTGAAGVYDGLAVAPTQRHLQRFDVAIAVPGLVEDRTQSCVGRTGRVFFSYRPLDWLRGLW